MFLIYFNRPTKMCTVHVAECNYPDMHGGVSGTDPISGWYIRDLPRLDDARRLAEEEAGLRGWGMRLCTVCVSRDMAG